MKIDDGLLESTDLPSSVKAQFELDLALDVGDGRQLVFYSTPQDGHRYLAVIVDDGKPAAADMVVLTGGETP